MAAVFELSPRPLPEAYTMPASAVEAIQANLSIFTTEDDVIFFRGKFIPDPAVENVVAISDAILIAYLTRPINDDEYDSHMTGLISDASGYSAQTVATQLKDIGQMLVLSSEHQPDEIRSKLVEEFCPRYGINPDVSISIFDSSIQHPALQATVMNLLTSSDEDLKPEQVANTDSLVLALRYHLLPESTYKIHALISSLSIIGLHKSMTDEVKSAVSVFVAAADLAYSISDRYAHNMMENAALVESALGNYDKSADILEKALEKADEIGIDAKKIARTKGNYLVSKVAYWSGESDISQDLWEQLEAEVRDAVIACRENDQTQSLVDLLLAFDKIQQVLQKRTYTQEQVRDAVNSLTFNLDDMHPYARALYDELFPPDQS